MSKYEYDPKDPFQLKRGAEQYFGPGKIFDQRSFWGNVRSFLTGCFMIYAGWHIYDLLAWWDNLRGVPYEIDPGKQAWARLWAVIFGGGTMLISVFAMIMNPIVRRRAARSAVGQWYDDPALTREALHGEQEDPATRAEDGTESNTTSEVAMNAPAAIVTDADSTACKRP